MSVCLFDGCGSSVERRNGGRAGFCGTHYQRIKRHGDPGRAPWASVTEGWIADHVSYEGEDCLIWPFARNNKGYPISKSRRREGSIATRLMCEAKNGPPPTPSAHAAHSCGNGSLGCIHPLHLAWKTPAGNEADKLDHGTHNRGERSAGAKLTADDVLFIRSKNGMKQRELAEKYGVSRGHIAGLQRGRYWPELQPQQP